MWNLYIILLKISMVLCFVYSVCSVFRNLGVLCMRFMLLVIGLMIIVVILLLNVLKVFFSVVMLLYLRMVVCFVMLVGMLVDVGLLNVSRFELVLISRLFVWLW